MSHACQCVRRKQKSNSIIPANLSDGRTVKMAGFAGEKVSLNSEEKLEKKMRRCETEQKFNAVIPERERERGGTSIQHSPLWEDLGTGRSNPAHPV